MRNTQSGSHLTPSPTWKNLFVVALCPLVTKKKKKTSQRVNFIFRPAQQSYLSSVNLYVPLKLHVFCVSLHLWALFCIPGCRDDSCPRQYFSKVCFSPSIDFSTGSLKLLQRCLPFNSFNILSICSSYFSVGLMNKSLQLKCPRII